MVMDRVLLNTYIAAALFERLGRFDMEQFRKLEHFDQIVKYLRTNAKLLGTGSARSAWDTGLGYVIKLGPGNNGREQNKHEAELHACSGESPIVPAVLARSKDLTWLAVERVTPVTGKPLDAAIKKMTDGTVKTVGELNKMVSIMKFYDRYVKTKTKLPEEYFGPHVVELHKELMRSNVWYQHLFDLVAKGCVRAGELHHGNWGLDTSKMLVLLDPGM